MYYAPTPIPRDLYTQTCFYAFLALPSLIMVGDGNDNRTVMRGASGVGQRRRGGGKALVTDGKPASCLPT